MKQFGIIVLACSLFISGCEKAVTTSEEKSRDCYSGKLVKKGMCGQYVIEVKSPEAKGLQIAATWHDPSSSKTYDNVFTVSNPCEFPQTIQEGEDFQFSVVAEGDMSCAFCYAYTPTPAARNNIVVGCTVAK